MWVPCRNCGELRKSQNIHTPDGLTTPPCVHCGDPGYIEPVGDGDLMEQGRRLASEREDLIAQGVDPSDLLIPLAPEDPA